MKGPHLRLGKQLAEFSEVDVSVFRAQITKGLGGRVRGRVGLDLRLMISD